MKVLITGGAGFLGKHLVKMLQRDNIVRIFDQSDVSFPRDMAESIKGNILDYTALEESCRGFDAVIHLAAITSIAESIISPKDTKRTNVEGTLNVLKSCVQNNINKIIFASSAAVYGDYTVGHIPEDIDTKPTSQYGQSKLDAEAQIRYYSEKFGMQGICLRLFNVYGRGQSRQQAGVIPRFVEAILENRQIVIYGDGTQTRDFVAVNDVGMAFALALNSDKSGTYNIGSSNPTSINELVQMISKISNKDITPIYEKKNPREIIHSVSDITLARNELHFEPKTKLKDGIEELISVPDEICH